MFKGSSLIYKIKYWPHYVCINMYVCVQENVCACVYVYVYVCVCECKVRKHEAKNIVWIKLGG